MLINYRLNEFISLLENKTLPLFDEGILMTRNFAKTAQFSLPNWEIPIKPVDYFLQILYPSADGSFDLYYILIDIEEKHGFKQAWTQDANFFKAVTSLPTRPYITLYSIQGEQLAGDLFNLGPQLDPVFKRSLIQIKFFDGRENFTKQEEPLLRQWLMGKEKSISDIFSKLYQNREKNDDFGNGILFRVIQEAGLVQKSQTTARINPSLTLPHPSSTSKKRPLDMTETNAEEEDFMIVDVAEENEEPLAKKQRKT